MTVGEWLTRFDIAVVAPPARRRDLRDELAAHFEDALAAGEAETEVTAAAGPPEQVAALCSRQASLVATERAVWFLLAGLLALALFWQVCVLLYPRGQWVTPPSVLYPPHHLGLAAWAAAGVVGAVALLALRSWRLSRRHAGLARLALKLLVAMVAVHIVAGTIYVWLRNGIVAGSPTAGAQIAVSALHLTIAAFAAGPLLRALRGLRQVDPGRSRAGTPRGVPARAGTNLHAGR